MIYVDIDNYQDTVRAVMRYIYSGQMSPMWRRRLGHLRGVASSPWLIAMQRSRQEAPSHALVFFTIYSQ